MFRPFGLLQYNVKIKNTCNKKITKNKVLYSGITIKIYLCEDWFVELQKNKKLLYWKSMRNDPDLKINQTCKVVSGNNFPPGPQGGIGYFWQSRGRFPSEPDTTQLFTTSNLIGPLYHAALLFSGLGSIVVLFVLLFSHQIREDIVRAAYCPFRASNN